MIKNIVFSGGSFNGISYIGCLRALEELNILADITTFVGSSSGAIVATLSCIGYTSDELYQLIKSIDFDKAKDINEDTILNFGNTYGLDSGNKIKDILELCIYKKVLKSKITFLELYTLTAKHLIITGTCLNKQNSATFDYKNTPDMHVCDALRISISIPFIFNKCEYNGHTYVDGGLVNNYPITLVENTNNTIGFCIKGLRDFEKIDSLQKYATSLIYSVITKLEDLQTVEYRDKTVYINCPKILNMFDISLQDKIDLYKLGYDKTIDYFNNKAETTKTKPIITLESLHREIIKLKRTTHKQKHKFIL